MKTNVNKIFKINDKNRTIILLGTLFVGLLIFITCSVFRFYVFDTLNTDKFYDGTIINGIDVSGKTKEEAKKLILDKLNNDQERLVINLYCDSDKMSLKGTDFVYEYNLDEVINSAYDFARNGNILSRCVQLSKMKNNSSLFKVTCNLNSDSLEKNVTCILNKFDDVGAEAHVEKFEPDNAVMFVYAPGKDGRRLNKDEVKNQLKPLVQDKISGDLFLKKYDYKNTTTIEDAKLHTQLLSEFKTVSTNSANSNINMGLSMKAINGTIVNPGEIFSFNGVVGDSNDPKRGFKPGAAILNGSVIMAYGGGVCQAATTVYGAATRANMVIVERKNHRFKSSYVPYGEDATIDYNNIDLKFRNDLKYPIYIKSCMNGKELICQMYGPFNDEYDKIDVKSWVSSRGHGVHAEAERIFYKGDKAVRTEALPSSFYQH